MVERPAWCHILSEENVSTLSHVQAKKPNLLLLFFFLNFISIFQGQCPQCATISPMYNTFWGGLGVAHWLRSV